jgi:peptidoglycan/xylan/chitin deacetylase (PgdA/CDA1 family)
MRTIGAAAFFVWALASLLQPAFAQEKCPPGGDKLGVARTVVINPSKAAHFGSQYKEHGALLADREVVLTFDDGPSGAYTRPILEALAAQCTRATFFMLGSMALADPRLVKEVARHGHTVATHTWSHANIQSLAEVKALDEIEMGFSAVQRALGKPVAPFFRFPYLRDTAATLHYLKGRQLAAFSIDIDSRDFQTKDAAAVYDRVLGEVTARRRGIILFHDIQPSTARALPRILEELKAQGFRVVHLTAKAGAETLAEYDALAQQEAERRRLAAGRNPLAKRAIAWPSAVLSGAKDLTKGEPAPAPGPRHDAPPAEDWTVNFWRQDASGAF